jgi:hypothetical protein
MIGVYKIKYPLEELCEGIPSEFYYYLKYCRNLEFDEKPNYAYLRKMFRHLLLTTGGRYDQILSWQQKDSTIQNNYNNSADIALNHHKAENYQMSRVSTNRHSHVRSLQPVKHEDRSF